MTFANNFIVVFTALIALCTLAYSVVSYFQLHALLESNQINRESLQSVQRAFVTFQDIGFGFRRSLGSAGITPLVDFTAGLANSGNTPAVDAIGAFEVEQIPAEPSLTQFIGTRAASQHINIDPRSTTALGPLTQPSTFVGIVDPTAKNLFSSKPPTIRPIFFWGRVVYNDVFPKTSRHLTEFCRRLTFVGYSADNAIRLNFVSCDHHNCNDEYCPDYKQVILATSK